MGTDCTEWDDLVFPAPPPLSKKTSPAFAHLPISIKCLIVAAK